MLTHLLFEVPPPSLLGPAAQLFRAFGAVAGGLVAWGMHNTARGWFNTLLRTFTRTSPGNNFIRRTSIIPGRYMVRAMESMFHFFTRGLSHQVSAKAGALERSLHGFNVVWRDHTAAISKTAKETGDALFRIRSVVLPREIHRSVNPVKAVAGKAYADAARSISVGRRNDRALGHKGIDKLRRNGLWPVATGLAVFDAFRILTHKQLKNISADIRAGRKATAHANATAKAASRAAAKANAHANALERSKVDKRTLAIAVEAALVAEFGSALRCRSLRNLTKRLRCSNWRFLGDLLGIGLAYLAVVDPVVIAKTAVKAEQLTDGVLKELAEPSAFASEASHVLADLLVGGVK